MTFQDLSLAEPVLRTLAEVGYEVPTPIQERTIPLVLAGRDVGGQAQTGTGKTAAFSLPILQHLAADSRRGKPAIRALVLTPTRELAAQIGESFGAYGKHLDLWHTVIFGGVKQKPQEVELRRGIDILVATPGRLLDLMGQAMKIYVLLFQPRPPVVCRAGYEVLGFTAPHHRVTGADLFQILSRGQPGVAHSAFPRRDLRLVHGDHTVYRSK